MITLKPQHDKIPDDILIRAHDFGSTCLLHGSEKEDMAIKGAGGFYYLQCTTDKDWAQVVILDITNTGIIFHPRTGSFAAMPIYGLDGNIRTYYGVLGGGWFPLGSTPSDASGGAGGGGGGLGSGGVSGSGGNGTPPSPPGAPINSSTTGYSTLNNPDGSVLLGPDSLPLRF